MKGIWQGYYQHESKRIPEDRRAQQTTFTIEITEFSNDAFIGNISENESTGGMKGVGEIIGKIKNGKISFTKQMPIQTLLVGKNRIETAKKHSKLYYSGVFDKTKNRYIGQWKFRFGFTRMNGKLAIRLPIRGKWEMWKEDISRLT